MGYDIQQVACKFQISSVQFNKALCHLFGGGLADLIQRSFTGGFCNATNVATAFTMWRYLPRDIQENSEQIQYTLLNLVARDARWGLAYDPFSHQIYNIWFTGQKYGNQQMFLCEIAACVDAGSFIVFQGEDGRQWIYEFDGKNCTCRDLKPSERHTVSDKDDLHSMPTL